MNKMLYRAQGLPPFLRAYFHYKSADWNGNKPCPLNNWTPDELAKMPSYYIMDLDYEMAESVLTYMPSNEETLACSWLSDEELYFYSSEFSRTGFQGDLNWYRCSFSEEQLKKLCLYSGLATDVPACTKMTSCKLVAGAGHWVQQEQSNIVADLVTDFVLSHPCLLSP